MKRKWEVLLGAIGGILSLVFFGGLAVTLRNMTASDFKNSYQSLSLETAGLSLEKTFQMLKDMTGLFAVVLFISLILLVIALFLSAKERYLPAATGLYFLTGAVLLIGTQFIAFPFAFFYFLAGALSFYRIRLRKES
ncbi:MULTISPECIES: DUF4064 domain-containing protein [unclassified Enterococcus]|uniref:DUF4064 domain-containing protein n=1 Tax=unclassified Enterococcus TaxID=2608891 RepID=UPI0013EC9D23|nr:MULTISPECIES: DUF4064 domain-containing protein [unclassified Enterococcus]